MVGKGKGSCFDKPGPNYKYVAQFKIVSFRNHCSDARRFSPAKHKRRVPPGTEPDAMGKQRVCQKHIYICSGHEALQRHRLLGA